MTTSSKPLKNGTSAYDTLIIGQIGKSQVPVPVSITEKYIQLGHIAQNR